MNDNNNNNDNYPLDDNAIAAISELREQQRNAQAAINGILMYFAKQHKLAGAWRLAQNDRELVLEQVPSQQP